MTLLEFRSLVVSMVEMFGAPSPNTPAAMDSLVVNPGVRDWCRRTECLRSDRIRWAPVAGRGAVRLDDPPANAPYPPVLLADPALDGTYATPVGMVALDHIWWAGTRLAGPDGRFGPTTYDDWDRRVGARWATEAPGRPRWWRVLGGELHVFPAPSSAEITAAGPNVYLSGAYSHPVMTGDAAPVLVPDEHVHLAARWCAVLLRRQTATGENRAALTAEHRELVAEAMLLRRRLDDDAHRPDNTIRGMVYWGETLK